MTPGLEFTRFRLGLCFRRGAGVEGRADEIDPADVVTELTIVVVTVGPVPGEVELPVEVEVPVDVELLPEEPVCELLRCAAAALPEGALRLAKSAGEMRLTVATYSCAPF